MLLLPLSFCLINLLILLVSNFVLWHILKFFNLHVWLYIPRRSKLAQRIQFGTLIFILPICYVVLYDLVFSLIISPDDYYRFVFTTEQNKSLLPWLIVVLNAILRDGVAMFTVSFGIFVEFLQFWIDNKWVNWVVETYPDHYKEILVQARVERKKWRTTHKTLPDFQNWVRELSARAGWNEGR